MENTAIEGQVEALSLTITALIRALPVAQARDARVNLAALLTQQAIADQQDPPGAAFVAQRDALVRAYLGLLEAHASRG